MTVSLRNENGDVILRRQVSSRWAKLEEFRGQLRQVGAAGEKFIAIVEACGFHDWLVKWLEQDDGCHRVLVVQPLGRSAAKTDRRDANALSELLAVMRRTATTMLRMLGKGERWRPEAAGSETPAAGEPRPIRLWRPSTAGSKVRWTKAIDRAVAATAHLTRSGRRTRDSR